VSLLALDYVIQSHALIECEKEIVAIHSDERCCLLILLACILREAVDANEEPDGVLALPSYLRCKDVSVSSTYSVLAPARFDDVVVGVES
jgi:hypothetical protein